MLGTGIQWGKSRVGAVRLKKAMHTYTSPDDVFILGAPTYKIMNQSSLPAFLSIMRGCGEYKEGKAEFHMYGGGICYMRTGQDPDSVVGMTNVRHIWGDEAGKYSKYFGENLLGRAAFSQCPVDFTTSPYALNWIYKDIILPALRGKRDDVELVQAASIENPFFPKEEYYAKEKTTDPRRFRMMYGGNWERMAGLVYECFSDQENMAKPFSLPPASIIVGGIDWGHTHPFVLLIHGITQDGEHYQISEFFKTGLIMDDIENLCVQKARTIGLSRIFCGPDKPENIEALNRAFAREKVKCVALPAENAVKFGIDKTIEMLRSRKLKFFEGSSPHTIDQLETYHWPEPEDLQPDQDDKEPNPVKQNDDAVDALRYLCVMTYKGVRHLPPIYPDSISPEAITQIERIERLKKRKIGETWS